MHVLCFSGRWLLMLLSILCLLFASSSQSLADDGVVIYGHEDRSQEFTPAQATSDTFDDGVVPPVIPRPHAGADSESLRVPAEAVTGWPVVVAGDTLFLIYWNLGPYTPAERAQRTVERIENLIMNPRYRDYPITLREEISGTEIVGHDLTISIVTHEDARIQGGLRQEIASNRAKMIQQTVDRERARRNPRAMVLGLLFTTVATIGLIVFWQLITVLARRIMDKLTGRHIMLLGPVGRADHLSSAEMRADRLIAGIKSLRILVQLTLVYAYATFVTGFFYATQGLHVSLNRQLTSVLDWAGTAFVGLLPKLFILATIATVTYIALQLLHLAFVGLSRGKLRWPGFQSDWALPTYRLVSIIIMLAALVVAWPHLPGSRSPAFTGVAIFVGVLVVLGSAVMIGNGIAGIILGFSVPFKIGDRVSISGTTGEVIGWTLLMTRLRTDKNVEVTIPNAVAMSGRIINFSRPGAHRNLILPTLVTVGYNVPWSQVQELLTLAALRTPHVLKEPAPFVNQKKLNPESAVYELNVYTNHPSLTQETISSLHRNIREVFAEAGIQLHAAVESADGASSPETSGEHLSPGPGARRFHMFPPMRQAFRRERPVPPAEEDIPE